MHTIYSLFLLNATKLLPALIIIATQIIIIIIYKLHVI